MAMDIGGGGGRNRGEGMAEINVTPLVDVLLVLLVIFMVTSPTVHHGAKIPTPDLSPQETSSEVQEEEKDTVKIDRYGRIYYKKRTVSLSQLYKLIRADRELQSKSEIFLQIDPELKYGKVMEILGTIRRAGIKKLGFIVDYADIIPFKASELTENKGKK